MSYGKTDLGAAKSEAAKFNSGNKWFKLKLEENYLRILPPWSSEVVVPWHKVALHWGCGPKSNRTVLCTHPNACYVCELVETLKKAKNERWKKIVRKESVLFNVINLNDPSAGAQMYLATGRTFGQIASYLGPKWGDITDVKNGRNITIVGSKQGENTSYQVMPDPTTTQIPEELMRHLDSMHKLNEAYRSLTYEQQRALCETGKYEFDDAASAGSGDADTDFNHGANATGGREENPVPPATAATGQNLNCFGRFTPGDAFCEECASGAKCKQAAGLAEAPASAPATPRPRCFGKEFDPSANVCKNCLIGAEGAKQCEAATRK